MKIELTQREVEILELSLLTYMLQSPTDEIKREVETLKNKILTSIERP